MTTLSENFVTTATLPRGKNDFTYWDSKLPGFAMRVRRKADGRLSKTFLIFQEMRPEAGVRKRRKIVIGSHSAFTADVAREEARAMLQAVKKGDDPVATRAAKKALPLFEDLVEDFEIHLSDKKAATVKDYRGRIRRNLLPHFRGKRVADITPEMVQAFMRKKRKNPVDANRSLAVLSKMMSWGGRRADNPCIRLPKFKEKAREDWLDEIDLPKFLATLAKMPAGAHRDIIQFLTVSGWRVSEARLLTWDMIDLARMVANLPDTKTGSETRELSTDAATIIDGQEHRIGFVFSSRKGRQPVSYKRLREVLRGVCEAAGVKQITPHGLRHTAATWTALAGAEAHELRQAFGWKTLAMTGRYVAKAQSLARRGVQRAADAMNVLQRPTAEIKELGSRRNS